MAERIIFKLKNTTQVSDVIYNAISSYNEPHYEMDEGLALV